MRVTLKKKKPTKIIHPSLCLSKLSSLPSIILMSLISSKYPFSIFSLLLESDVQILLMQSSFDPTLKQTEEKVVFMRHLLCIIEVSLNYIWTSAPTCYGFSHKPDNSPADNPFSKLMGIREKLACLLYMFIEHWSLTWNKLNLSDLLQFVCSNRWENEGSMHYNFKPWLLQALL